MLRVELQKYQSNVFTDSDKKQSFVGNSETRTFTNQSNNSNSRLNNFFPPLMTTKRHTVEYRSLDSLKNITQVEVRMKSKNFWSKI